MTPERLQELLNGFIDDQLDADGQRELARALETDEEARRAFVRATDQHEALRDLLGRTAAQEPRRWKPWAVLGAVAAALLIALLFYVLQPGTPPPNESKVATPERKPAPPPEPPPPSPPPDSVPEPLPEPKPLPLPPVPRPEPPAPPREPEKPAPTPEPKPPKPRPEPPPTPVPAPPRETTIAAASLESVRGEVFLLAPTGRKPAAAGQPIPAGHGVATGSGDSFASVVFGDGTRVEIRKFTTLQEISSAPAKRIVLDGGSLIADVAKQPAGLPMILATRSAEATVLGTRLALHSAEGTKLEVKEGQVRFTRLEDKRSVVVNGGFSSVALKGADLAPRKITRGPMVANALWAEDFQDPDEVERDWHQNGTSLPLTFARGQLEIDASSPGEAWFNLRSTVTPALRITMDVEFTQRPRNTLVALRLQSWKVQKDNIHIDVDDDFYYLRIADVNVVAPVTRKAPRQERWTVEIAADGNVNFLIDGKFLLKGKRTAVDSVYHLHLLTRAYPNSPAGAKVRFDNLILERMK